VYGFLLFILPNAAGILPPKVFVLSKILKLKKQFYRICDAQHDNTYKYAYWGRKGKHFPFEKKSREEKFCIRRKFFCLAVVHFFLNDL
jgi:hypothetical protein